MPSHLRFALPLFALGALVAWWAATQAWVVENVGYLDLDMSGPGPVLRPALSLVAIGCLLLTLRGRPSTVLLGIAGICLVALVGLALVSVEAGLRDGQISSPGVLVGAAAATQLLATGLWLYLAWRTR